MRKTCFLTAAGLLAALTVLPAQAQWHDDDRYGYDGYGHDRYGDNNGSFRCESRDRRTTRCATRGYRVQLIRQFSDMPCVRGRTWGQDGYGVWVTNGCRALFRFDDRNHWGGNGWNNGWNNNGGHHGGDFVRCESRDNRSRTCPMSVGRNNGIRLVRQLSDTPCIEGRNWGTSRNGVWVSGGCRAEFVVSRGRGGGGWERPPGDLGDQRPPGDLGNGYRSGDRTPRQGNDDGPPPGVIREIQEGQGGRNRGPRLVDVPPPGVVSGPVGGSGRPSLPPGQIQDAPRPRPRPISVAQSDNRPPPGPPQSSEPAPGVFRTLPAEEAPASRPARQGQEERTPETP